MNTHHKIHRWFRLILSSVLLVVLTACVVGAKPASTDKFVTATGFVCPEPSPRVEFESDTINIFTWAEYVPNDMFDCFGLVYDVTVNVDYFSSNEELYSKISLGQEINPYDVIHPSDYMISVLIREELLQQLDFAKIPNFANLDPSLLTIYGSTTNFVVPYQMGTQAIVYNTETVKTPPTSWADLWNPEYKGRIVAMDDNRVIIGMSLLTLGYDVNDTIPEHLEEAKTKLIELMPNIRLFETDSPKTALLAGDVDLGIVGNGEAYLAYSENSAFRYVFPEEGSIIFFDGMALPTTAPHPDIAYAWFNYLLQADVNWLTIIEQPYTTPNLAALEFAKENHTNVYRKYIDSPITNTPLNIYSNGHEVLDLGEALLLYDKIWTEIKK